MTCAAVGDYFTNDLALGKTVTRNPANATNSGGGNIGVLSTITDHNDGNGTVGAGGSGYLGGARWDQYDIDLGSAKTIGEAQVWTPAPDPNVTGSGGLEGLEVWASDDGTTYTQVTAVADWIDRGLIYEPIPGASHRAWGAPVPSASATHRFWGFRWKQNFITGYWSGYTFTGLRLVECAASPWALGDAGSPRGLSGAPEYVIEIFDSGATFGPNTKLAEVWDARNIGWSRYDRLPGKAFFTLAQTSATLPLLTPLLTHIAIWRITPNGDTLVYRGVYVDSNNTGDDVILDCFDYKALLSVSRSGFKTLYPTKLLGTQIVSPEWVLAKGATSSPLGFVTTGTIEDPLALDGVTAIKTNAQFGTLDQTRLQLFYDLTEMGRANTANQVTFDIDLTNTFHFYKNRGVASGLALVLGGNISDYGYLPGWARYRNDVATVGVATAGGSSEIVATNAAEITAKGRRQDVTTLKTLAGIGGGATETDQQKAALERDLKQLVQQQSTLMLRVERGKVEPFVGYALNDTALIEIGNGIDTITGTRRIIGIRCLFAEAGEDVDILVAQVAT